MRIQTLLPPGFDHRYHPLPLVAPPIVENPEKSSCKVDADINPSTQCTIVILFGVGHTGQCVGVELCLIDFVKYSKPFSAMLSNWGNCRSIEACHSGFVCCCFLMRTFLRLNIFHLKDFAVRLRGVRNLRPLRKKLDVSPRRPLLLSFLVAEVESDLAIGNASEKSQRHRASKATPEIRVAPHHCCRG